MSKEEQESDHGALAFSVCVIGGGYSALALACALKKQLHEDDSKSESIQGRGAIEVTIFESMDAPDNTCTTEVQGNIRLPNGHESLRRMGFSDLFWKKLKFEAYRNHATKKDESFRVSRQQLRKMLYLAILDDGSKGEEGKVVVKLRYLHRVLQIQFDDDKRYGQHRWFCQVENRLLNNRSQRTTGTNPLNKTICWYGPFDILIGADGVRSMVRQCLQRRYAHSSRPVACLIGDARWTHQRWWDLLGHARVRCGADIALMDGIELGEILLKQHHQCKEGHYVIPEKFWSRPFQRTFTDGIILIFLFFLLTIVFSCGGYRFYPSLLV